MAFSCKKPIRKLKSFFREYGMFGLSWVFIITLSLYYHASCLAPKTPDVLRLYELGQKFWYVVVLFLVLQAGLKPGLTRANRISRILMGLALYSIVLWLIGHYGDESYRWMATNPKDAIVYFVILVLFDQIAGISGWMSRELDLIVGATTGGLQKLSAHDTRCTPAHEAGHVLVHAALSDLPASLKVVVNKFASPDGVMGYATMSIASHHFQQKTFIEWYMLVLLAGESGELIIHGETTLGSSGDHREWSKTAKRYLANQYRGMYHHEPRNEFEQRQNDLLLESLLAEQKSMLHTFFEVNIDVFKQLVDTLKVTQIMKRKELTPFLNRVTVPAEFPRPTLSGYKLSFKKFKNQPKRKIKHENQKTA